MTTRRTFMGQSAAAASALAFPLVGGAQPKPIKIGAASYWGDSEVDRVIAAYTRGASEVELKDVVAQIHAERLS